MVPQLVSSRVPRGGLLLGLLALASCDPTDPETCVSCDDSPTCSVTQVIAAGHVDAPQIVEVTWRSSEPGAGYVEFGLDLDLGEESDPTLPQTDHHVDLLGLKAGHTYTYRAVSRCADGTVARGPLGTFDVPPPPRELGSPTVTWDDELPRPEGLILLSEFGVDGSWIVVIDRDGDTVWHHRADPTAVVLSSRLSPDGHGVAYSQHGIDQLADMGATVTVPFLGGRPVYTCNLLGHHVSAQLPEGALGFLSVELGWYEVEGVLEYVASDAILETPSGSDDCDLTEQVFSFFDDYGHDPWPASDQFYRDLAGGRDWTHANSLVYHPDTDDYFLGARNLDALLRIDRGTGEVLWQMGGEHGDFAFADESDRWNHGHFSEVWEGGALIFDNLGQATPPVSRVAEYAWDEEARTVELVWEYVDACDRVAAMGGDAKRLPNGNVLVSWGSLGLVTEITRDGRVAWEAELPLGIGAGRVTWLEDLAPPH